MNTTTKPRTPPPADALADLRDVLAVTRTGKSWVFDAIAKGQFPRPIVQQHRFTRWRAADVRAWAADPVAWLGRKA